MKKYVLVIDAEEHGGKYVKDYEMPDWHGDNGGMDVTDNIDEAMRFDEDDYEMAIDELSDFGVDAEPICVEE